MLKKFADPSRRVDAMHDFVVAGELVQSAFVMNEGWSCRYNVLKNGKRQIISVFLAGDLCEPFGRWPSIASHSVIALTPVVVTNIPTAALRNAARVSPAIERALWCDLQMATAIEREQVVNIGRRTASERVGHFFCELHVRLARVGLVDDLSFDMPITQADLADLLGLSTVHLNRSLQELRRSGMLSLRARRLTIHDLEGLRELSLFDETYLQINGIPPPEMR